MKESPYQHLRFGVGAAYLRHIIATDLLIMHIGYAAKLIYCLVNPPSITCGVKR